MRLDELPPNRAARIVRVDPERIDAAGARRLAELGFGEGVRVETLHRGPFGLDPIACRVGRMTVALRRALAAAVLVEQPG